MSSGTGTSSAVVATGAAGAAVTMTLPAPASGLRIYLDAVRIARHTSALLVAGATPTIITTTNLPGSLTYSIPTDAALAGTVYEKVDNGWGRLGLASSAQATAVTFVAPAVTSTIWHMTAFYYVAP